MLTKFFRKWIAKECSWKLGVHSYIPACKMNLSHSIQLYEDMEFCPFCGRKIKYAGEKTVNRRDIESKGIRFKRMMEEILK